MVRSLVHPPILIYILASFVACHPIVTLPNETSESVNNNQATTILAETTTSRPAIIQVFSAPTLVESGLPPFLLFTGTFKFHPTYSPKDLSAIMLDFDKQKFDPVVNRGNDIRVDVAPGRYPIIVAAPMNGASGIYLKTVNLGADFDLNSYYDDCNQNVSGFLKGGIPFDYQGDLFCWQTNEGFLADFVIEKLYGPYTNYIVEIKYHVWNQLLN